MKIGLLTYHASINPGAFWQCFSTCQLLQRLGHDVVVLDYRAPFHPRNPLAPALQLADWIHPSSVFWLVRAQFRHRRDMKLLPVSRPLTDLTPGNLPFDAIVVGSDIVWKYPFDPVFFGQVFHCPKMIAYAASMGGKNGNSAKIPDFLQRPTPFTSISCRDANTMALLARCDPSWSKGAVLVGDPTVTLKVPDAFLEPMRKSPYCLLYVSGAFSSRDADSFRRFCTRRGWIPVSLFYPHPGMENLPFTSARTAMRLFANAAMVVTDAFHGALLPRLHGVPVVYLSRKKNLPFKTREQFSSLAIANCVALGTDELDHVSEIAENIPAIGTVLPPLAKANADFIHQSLER